MSRKSKELVLIDKPHFHYWQALYMSFCSSRLYVDVAKRWRGTGALYLLLLLAIIVAPFALRVTLSFNDYFETQIIEPIAKMPPIKIRNGEVIFDKKMPYFIKNSKGQVVTIIDTTGKITEIGKAYPYLSTLITKDKFIYRYPTPELFIYKQASSESNPVYEQSFDDNMNETFNAEKWLDESGVKSIKTISDISIYPTLVLVFFVLYLTFFLAFALMGQLVAKLFMKMSLSYLQACRLLIVASTPQLLTLILCLTLDWTFPGISMFLIAILAFYFSYAVLAVKRESQQMVHS